MLSYYYILFCLSAKIILTYAHPLYQTYGPPCQCQHNPWYPADLMFEPTNIDPYAVMPQASQPTYQTPAYNQEYVNRILSDPTLRTILDPNTILFDINGIEIPRFNPESCPNVINNYIIIPPEVLAQKQISKERRKKNGHKRKIKTSHRNTSKNRNIIETNNQKIEPVMNLPNNSHGKNYDNEVKHNLILSENNNQKLNERKPKVKDQNKNSNVGLEKALDHGGVTVKEKEKVIRLKIITHPVNPNEEEVVQEFRRQFPGIPEDLVRSLLAYLKRKLSNGEIGTNDQISYIPPNKKKRKPSALINNISSRRKKGRKRKNPKKKQDPTKDKKCESTLVTSTNSFDNIEESIAINNDTRNITKYLEHVEINSTDSPSLVIEDVQNIFAENEEIVETNTVMSILDKDTKFNNVEPTQQNINEDSQDVNKYEEKNIEISDKVLANEDDKRIEQKVNQEESDDIIDQNINKYSQDVIKFEEKVTEKSDEILDGVGDKELEQKVNQEKTNNNIDQIFKPDTDGHKLNYNYNLDNTRLPELGTEDEMSITVNGLFEDYYPDFRAENRFAISNEEFQSPDSNAERYHYTTDKSIETGELSRERRKYEQNYNKNHHTKFVLNEEKIYETDKHKEKITDALDGSVPVSMTVQKETEEITFIAPPALERPDFETKNIRELKTYYEEGSKYEPIYKYSDVSDKTSVYSNSKSSKYDKTGSAWKKEKHGDLETVYGRSKVRKYGHNSDDANIIVIAESYPDYEW